MVKLVQHLFFVKLNDSAFEKLQQCVLGVLCILVEGEVGLQRRWLLERPHKLEEHIFARVSDELQLIGRTLGQVLNVPFEVINF